MQMYFLLFFKYSRQGLLFSSHFELTFSSFAIGTKNLQNLPLKIKAAQTI